MGNETSKGPASPTRDINLDPNGARAQSSQLVDPEYCWATAYWTVQHENDAETGLPRTAYRSNPTANFAGETVVQRLSNRLKLYRHPKIVKYMDSFNKGGTSHLNTEYCYPLLTDPSNRNSAYLVCQGLLDVIQALSFLHYNAKAAHNNISLSSIFYCPLDKRWKLGGLQWVERYQLINNKYLRNAKPHLEEKFIPPEDNVRFSNPLPTYHEGRDVYGLGCVIVELLQHRQDELPAQKDFLHFAKTQMMALDPAARPSLTTIAEHSFFQQHHVQILDFLQNVPLKSAKAKSSFFSTLTQRLFKVPEEVIGELLVPALLSRMVIIDETARRCFLPNMLTPEVGNQGYRKSFSADADWNPVLGATTFRAKVCDSLVKIFFVHDYTVRMVLLEHFPNYVSLLDPTELESSILPNLLQGLKDSHEDLVSATLVALSYVVPILGATRVVGQPRMNLFSDGLPSKSASVSGVEDDGDPDDRARRQARVPQKAPSTIRPSPIGAEEETRLMSHNGITTTAAVPSAHSDVEEGTAAGWGEWEEEEDVVEDAGVTAEPVNDEVLEATGGQEENEEEEFLEEIVTPAATIPQPKVLAMAPFELTEDNPLAAALKTALQGMQLHVYQGNGGVSRAEQPAKAKKKAKETERKEEPEDDIFAGLGMEPAIKKTVKFGDERDKEESSKKTASDNKTSKLEMEVKSDDDLFDEGGGWGDELDEPLGI